MILTSFLDQRASDDLANELRRLLNGLVVLLVAVLANIRILRAQRVAAVRLLAAAGSPLGPASLQHVAAAAAGVDEWRLLWLAVVMRRMGAGQPPARAGVAEMKIEPEVGGGGTGGGGGVGGEGSGGVGGAAGEGAKEVDASAVAVARGKGL